MSLKGNPTGSGLGMALSSTTESLSGHDPLAFVAGTQNGLDSDNLRLGKIVTIFQFSD